MTLSLREKVGQLIQVQVPGKDLTPEVADFFRRHAIGGAIFFRDNVDTPAQVAQYVARLQALAPAGLPLLLGVDQEGGAVTVLQRDAAPAPAPMALGALGEPALAGQAAVIIARDLREAGFNLVYAPVADVNLNPRNPIIGERSFGSDPHQVAAFVAAQVGGFQAEGVAACAKHFPGHGDTEVDSHLNLPTVSHPRARLEEAELVPFRAAIAAGAAALMTAHITYPALDAGGLPATLSRPILTGLLRERLGFTGLCITDSMTMHAIARYTGSTAAAAMAIAAGADMVLACGTLEQARRMWEGVYAAAESGRIPRARLDEAVTRVAVAKAKWARQTTGQGWRPRSAAARAADHAAAWELAARAVTVIRDDAHLLPLALNPGARLAIVAPELAEPPQLLGAARPLAHLTAAAREFGLTVDPVAVGLAPDAAEIAAAVQAAGQATAVLLCTCARGPLPPAQKALAEALLAMGTPVAVAAIWGPYHVYDLPAAPTFLCTYGTQEPALHALVAVLTGRRRPEGRLPGPRP